MPSQLHTILDCHSETVVTVSSHSPQYRSNHVVSRVGPKDSGIVRLSASRRSRIESRIAEGVSLSAARKLNELLTIEVGEIEICGRSERGTTLVMNIPNTPRRLFADLATHGSGVSVERGNQFGWGLVSKRNFVKNSYITQYEGMVLCLSETSCMDDSAKTHFFGIGNQFVIDGLKEPLIGRGAASFANHSTSPNSRFFKSESGVFLRALRAILCDQWITVSYGSKFLSSHGKAIHGIAV